MTRRPSLMLALLLVAVVGCDEAPIVLNGADRGVPDPAGDLRLDQLQIKGTHNSYHLAPESPLLPELGYSHPPLAEQLEQGIRQFELDIHPQADGYGVYHIPGIDERTTCATLAACLGEIEAWSAANPWHHVLFIFIEPKFIDAAFAEPLDAAIRAAWPRDRLIVPDDVRGAYPDLQTALAIDGWPTVAETRGKAMFFLFDSDDPRDDYVAGNPSLAGRVMFPRLGVHEDAQPFGAFTMSDTVDPERFAEHMSRGLMVRTRADDAQNRAEAISLGVHFLSFDFPERWPGGTRCNPVTAPADCDSATIEPR